LKIIQKVTYSALDTSADVINSEFVSVDVGTQIVEVVDRDVFAENAVVSCGLEISELVASLPDP
jgi:hypothetical protein